MSAPIALIIGAGPNIGAAVAKAFAAKGYTLALAARSLTNGTSPEGYLHVKVDLSDPENVKTLFATVKEKLGLPSVVAYNAAYFTSDGPDPILGFSPSTLSTSVTINASSAIVAMAESIRSFRSLPPTSSKTFLYTGNCLNTLLIPSMLSFGIAKSATAYAIRAAATNKLYTDAGMKFYYVDERTASGGPIMPHPDGEEAARISVLLSEKGRQGEGLGEGEGGQDWDYTYVKGVGAVKF